MQGRNFKEYLMKFFEAKQEGRTDYQKAFSKSVITKIKTTNFHILDTTILR